MQIDKVVISYNYLQFKLPKKKNGPILTNAYYDDNLWPEQRNNYPAATVSKRFVSKQLKENLQLKRGRKLV